MDVEVFEGVFGVEMAFVEEVWLFAGVAGDAGPAALRLDGIVKE